jgi:serine/threonine-protein kinase
MSPEQASGQPGSVTTASDVYGLGAVLYAMLTGRAPFEGSSVRETIARLNDEPPEPPSRLNRAVPPPLDQICLKCLEKEPARRYATAEAMASDLRRWLAGEPISARPEPLSERTRRWMRRRRTAVAAIAAAVLATLVGLAVVLAVQVKSNRELEAANEREQARFNLAREAIQRFYVGVSEDMLLKEPQFHAMRARLLREAHEFFGKLEDLLKGHTDQRSRRALADAYSELAALTDSIGSKTDALELHGRGLAIRRELARETPADPDAQAEVGRCLLSVGSVQSRIGRADDALASYDEARTRLAGAHRLARRMHDFRPELARCDYMAGELLAAIGRADEALGRYRNAQSIRQAMERDGLTGTPSRGAMAETEAAIGVLLWESGHPGEAVESLGKAQARLAAIVRDRPADAEVRRRLARCYNAIGYPLHALGRTDEALGAFEAARDAFEALIREHPTITEFRQQLAYSEAQIGTVLSDTGRRTEALAPYRRAQLVMEALTQENPDVAEFRNDLARCYSQTGQALDAIGEPVKALASIEKARLLRDGLVAAQPTVTVYRSNLGVTLGYLGAVQRGMGRFGESATSYRRAIAVLDTLRTLTPEDDYNLACYHSSLAGLADKPGTAVTAAEARDEADRAMDNLRRAAATGFRMSPLITGDRDLDPLRPRPDFRVLMMDLAFPEQPFAR